MIYNTWVGGMKIDYVKQDTAIPTQIYDFFKLSKELYMIHYTYTYIHVIHNTNTRDFGVSEHYARPSAMLLNARAHTRALPLCRTPPISSLNSTSQTMHTNLNVHLQSTNLT